MVGVALALSSAKRQAGGQSFGRMFAHALWRGFMLVILAVFLTSLGSSNKHTVWEFTNVLAQIGLGYPILFLLAFTSTRTQVIAAAVILLGDWAAFALWPLPPADLNWAAVDVSPHWPHLTGFAAHWEKNTNIATAFDQWFLNLFPRETRYAFGRGYQTLNFVPALATMIFGLITGTFLRSSRSMGAKVGRLVLAGICLLGAGEAFAISGVCPMVKHLWTPTFAIFSTGWVLLFLAFFVAVVEWAEWKRWAFPLLVAGLNPITLYVLWQSMGGFITENIRRHFGQDIFKSFEPIEKEALRAGVEEGLRRAAILLVLWLILWWMYRRKIVVRI
jgi:predicted acyltransferase